MSPRRASSTDVNGEAEPDDTTVEGVCVCSDFDVKTTQPHTEYLKLAQP